VSDVEEAPASVAVDAQDAVESEPATPVLIPLEPPLPALEPPLPALEPTAPFAARPPQSEVERAASADNSANANWIFIGW